MSIKQGDTAPGFELACKPGETIDLGQILGQETTVLLFFPLAFSPVCTDEMCHFRDNWSDWESLNAKVFGLSVDSPFITEKFRQELDIPFPVLSDFNKDVSRLYGALHEDLKGMKGVSKRSAFVIGSDGIVKYAWISDNPGQQVNFDEIRAAISS
ncbi:MAG: redoxin domain-containing protein [Planctomycetota bacterium]|nr:redoxin domain-containing protein [Planctomycetota bacterium]